MKKDRVRELFLEQLKKVPIVAIATEKAGISRAIYYVWRAESEEFRKAADTALAEGEATINDLSESVLLQRIKNGELPPATFWLRHRHPKFKNRVEVEATIRAPREELTPEQEEAVKKALAFAGLLENSTSAEQSNGADNTKEINNQNNNHEQQSKPTK